PTEQVKKVETKQPEQTAKAAPPPPKVFVPPPTAVEAAVPPPVTLDGIFTTDTIVGGDAISNYKQQVETQLRARWERPSNVTDVDFVAEVEMRIDTQGKIIGYDWKKGSGNTAWDNSVKKALANGAINRSPPKGFPDKFVVRFDVQETTEP